MGKKILTFDNNEVGKYIFYQHENPISVYDVNIDRIVVCKFDYYIYMRNNTGNTTFWLIRYLILL